MRVHDEWLLTPQRTAIHEPTKTAVAADLHLGYHEARRQAGDAVPLVALASILTPLAQALAENGVHRLVLAGDVFEKEYVPSIWRDFHAWLSERGITLAAVVLGNHDRCWPDNLDLPLQRDAFHLGDWRIVHGHLPAGKEPTVLGHWHPAMRYAGRMSPCYLVQNNRLVLPAFSPEAAGGDVWAVGGWQGHRCLVIHAGRVVDVGVISKHAAIGLPKTTHTSQRLWRGRLRSG